MNDASSQKTENTAVLRNISAFVENEFGAVTVDWIVLTGVIVGFGLLIIIPISNSITTAAENIEVTTQTSSN